MVVVGSTLSSVLIANLDFNFDLQPAYPYPWCDRVSLQGGRSYSTCGLIVVCQQYDCLCIFSFL
uniref:Uncharacterized protein n=1 Tax=Arundo donax TaxID=35708 RepID=A0A0A9GLS4_ARUDO